MRHGSYSSSKTGPYHLRERERETDRQTDRQRMLATAHRTLTLWRPLLPYGYNYKASCARLGWAFICNFWHPGTLTLRAECQSARMSKITNDGLTWSGTQCCIAVPNGNSGRQMINTTAALSPEDGVSNPYRFVKWKVHSVMALFVRDCFHNDVLRLGLVSSGAFLAAAVWGDQRRCQICILGPRIPDDIIHDRVNGVIWHQLCNVTL